MAFQARFLSCLTYANQFTLWHYRARTDDGIQGAGDSLHHCMTKDYFAPASDLISNGDCVIISANDGSAMIFIEHDDIKEVDK